MSLSRAVRALALFVALGVPALLAYTLNRQYAQERADAETRAVNTARAMEQHAARTFETIDTYLRAVASLVGPRADHLSPQALHAALHEQFARTRLNNIMIIDRDGTALVEAVAFPARALDVRDRDYFQTLRDTPGGGLVVGSPIHGRLTGKLLIPVARRIDNPNGSFAGVVQAMLDPDAFQAVYEAIDNGPGATLSLWRTDGTLLVRTPPRSDLIGRNFAGGENYRRHVPARDAQPFWSAGITDGVQRVIALGFLDDYPLYVGAALSRDDALADWRRSAIIQGSVAGGLTTVLVAALLLLAREVEKRQSADVVIRQSEARYRLLAENTSDLIVFKPTMTERGYVSPAVRTILGWEPEEYAELPPAAIIHPDEMSEVAAIYTALSPDRPQATHVHRLRHKAGHYVWIESVFRLVGRDPHDRTVVVSGRDVTARRAADEALRTSEARYRLLSEATTDMVTLMDLTGRRLYVSPASRDLLGHDPGALIGTSPQQAIHPDDAAGLAALFSDLREGHRECGVNVNRLRHRDGRWIWVEASLKRLQDGEGRTTGFVASVRNIEARKAVEAALLAARVEAERASAAKGEFLAAMSHEIRTPLNGVIGYSDLLLDEADLGPEVRNHAECIRVAGAALLTLVNDILDFSKVEAGQVMLVPEPFALKVLIDSAVAIVRGSAERKGLTLHVMTDPVTLGWVVGDQDRLRQVLLNLLSNAIKFTPAGEVALRAEARLGEYGRVNLRFAVRDSGIGIPQDKQHLLFQRFSQIDGSVQRAFGGTGLGLAICKGLVTCMGGDIGVESEAGRGSTFWFTVELPIAERALVPQRGWERASVRAGRRVLLADDVMLNQDLARAILEKAGHTVDVVANGAEAVRAVQAHSYDLVLMDVQMPVMDGITATRIIRAFGHTAATVPIIGLTANVLPEQAAEILAAGMDDHVGKPFRREALLDAVERWTTRDRPSQSKSSAVDRAILDEMRETVGSQRVNALLGKLTDGLMHWFGPSVVLDRNALLEGTHAMVSATGMLGFTGLMQACREVEAACRSGENYDAPLAALRRHAAEAIEEIAALRAA